MNRVGLSIGGIGLEVQWNEPNLLERGLDWPLYESFCHEGSVEVNLALRRGTAQRGKGELLLFDGKPHWTLSRHNGWDFIDLFESGMHRHQATACLHAAWSSGEVLLTPEEKPRPWSLAQLMRPLGELLLVHHLSRKAGMMIHGLGVNDRGCGLAFIGASGSGKSSLAKLLGEDQGVTILNDERIILRRLGGSFHLFGTPWPGDARRWAAEPVALKRLFFIYHEKTNIASPLGAIASVQELVPQLFLSFWDPEALALALSTAQALLQEVPCYRLGFVNDRRIASFLRQMGGG